MTIENNVLKEYESYSGVILNRGDIVLPSFSPRQHRRIRMFELLKIIPRLYEIESYIYERLLHYDEHSYYFVSYEDCIKEVNILWVTYADWISAHGRLKLCAVNYYYLFDTYLKDKTLETEINLCDSFRSIRYPMLLHTEKPALSILGRFLQFTDVIRNRLIGLDFPNLQLQDYAKQ